jgi:hypothetical protein
MKLISEENYRNEQLLKTKKKKKKNRNPAGMLSPRWFLRYPDWSSNFNT